MNPPLRGGKVCFDRDTTVAHRSRFQVFSTLMQGVSFYKEGCGVVVVVFLLVFPSFNMFYSLDTIPHKLSHF